MSPGKAIIVVVEDDAGLNQALARLLEAAGFSPTMFESAEALLAADTAASADCLVLDLHLPGMSGLQLHDKLKEISPPPPCIVITAYDDAATRRGIKGIGAAAVLIKPFKGQALVSAVQKVLGRSASGPIAD